MVGCSTLARKRPVTLTNLYWPPGSSGPRSIHASNSKKGVQTDDQEETVECRCQNRVHSSSCRAVQQGCGHNCADTGFQEGLTERPRFRHAYAYFFHQPRRTQPHRQKTERAKQGKISAFRTRAPGEETKT